MLRDTNMSAWCAIGLLLEQYEAKHHGHALHIYGDKSGHIELGETVIVSFDHYKDLPVWLHAALQDPASVSVSAYAEGNLAHLTRVSMEQLHEVLTTLLNEYDEIELYREDTGPVSVCLDTGDAAVTYHTQDDQRYYGSLSEAIDTLVERLRQ